MIEDKNLIYYKALIGDVDLDKDEWYINYDSNYAMKIYSDHDFVSNNKAILPPTKTEELIINTFSDKIGQVLDNVKVVDYDTDSEAVKMEMDDRVVSIIVDQSGSMTWNDNQGLRFNVIEKIVENIKNHYPGNVHYNLFEYGSRFVNVLFFGTIEEDLDIHIDDAMSLGSLLFKDRDANYAGIRCVRNQERYPASPIDGDVIIDGYVSKIFDEDLESDITYYYKLYTYDKDYNFSDGVKIKVTPRERIIPRGVSAFRSIGRVPGEMYEGKPLIGTGALRDKNTVALWHMDEGIGNNLYDFSKSKLNFKSEEGEEMMWLPEEFVPSGDSGIILNKKTIFTKDNDKKLSFGKDELGNYPKGLSILLWLSPSSLTSESSYDLISLKDDEENYNYKLSIDGYNLNFSFGDESAFISDSSIPMLSNSSWYHIAITYDTISENLKYYVNGEVLYNESVPNPDINLSEFNDMTFNLSDEDFIGRITEVSVHNICRSEEYIQSQLVYQTKEKIDIETEEVIEEEHIWGLKGDNGDRIIALRYIVPQDYNFEDGSVCVIRKDNSPPSWEGDGEEIYKKDIVTYGEYFLTDVVNFVHDDTYYYKIYSINSEGNYSDNSDSPVISVKIPSGGNDYWPSLDYPLESPELIQNKEVAIPGNQRSYLSWNNTFDNDDRVEKVQILYSNNDYPVYLDDGGFTGEIIYSGKDNFFIHKNLQNDIEVFYTIVNIDKYGRPSDPIMGKCTPVLDADESLFPLQDVQNVHYEIFDENSVSIGWDLPKTHPNNIEAYFDETVVFYGTITDEYGQPLPSDSLIKIHLIPDISREDNDYAEEVFGYDIDDFEDSNAYSFSISHLSSGLIKCTLRMSSDASIISRIKSATFKVQIKSFIPSSESRFEQKETEQSVGTNPLDRYIEIIDELIDDIEGVEEQQESRDNVFEYLSKPIVVNFKNPWEIQLENRDGLKVDEKCYYYDADEVTGLDYLRTSSHSFNGIYMNASNPFMARVKVFYKGGTVPSGTIRAAIWDAEKELCTCAGVEGECYYEGRRIQESEMVSLPSDRMDILDGFETIVENGEEIQKPISYVDIPIFAPNKFHAIQLYVTASHAGLSSFRNLYIVFQNILKMDINANAPIPDGGDVAEQQSTSYIIDPDFPNDKSKRTYPEDNSIVQWKIEPIWRIRRTGPLTSTELDVRRRDLFSLDDVPISNGVFSYTINGTARNVFLGPISRDDDRITEYHVLSSTIVYDGLTATAKQSLKFRFYSRDYDQFGARFLMEMEYFYRHGSYGGFEPLPSDAYDYRPEKESNRLWADGIDYTRVFISRNPAVAKTPDEGGYFLSAKRFRDAAQEENSDLLMLSEFGQIVQIDAGDNDIEIAHGNIIEQYNESTNRTELILQDDSKIEYGTAFVTLNPANISDTTTIYIRANKTWGDDGPKSCVSDDYCEREDINLSALDLTDCDLPGGNYFLSGITTLFVDGEPINLVGGGDMENGVPPCPLCLREPLSIRTIYIMVDGIEVEELKDLTFRSNIEIKVEVLFRGKPVPENTPLNVNIQRITGGDLSESPLFQSTSNIIYTYNENNKSFAKAILFGNRIYENHIIEEVEIVTTYDETENTERRRTVSHQIETKPIEEEEIVDPYEDEIIPPEVEFVPDIYSKLLYRYDIEENKWDRMVDSMYARGDAFYGFCEQKMYMVGGLRNNLKNNRSISDKNEEFDISLNKWSERKEILTPRYGGMSATIDDKIYTIGGIGINIDDDFYVSDKIEVYDSGLNEWEELSSMPYGVAYGTSQIVAINDKTYIYVMSGITSIRKMTDIVEPDEYNKFIMRYCVEDDIWDESEVVINDNNLILYQRLSPLSLLYNNKIIIFNGSWSDVITSNRHPNFEVISFELESEMSSYTTLDYSFDLFDNLPQPKLFSAMIEPCIENPSIFDKYYIIGGAIKEKTNVITGVDINESLYLSEYDKYNYDNSWDEYSSLVSLPIARYGHIGSSGIGSSELRLELEENNYINISSTSFNRLREPFCTFEMWIQVEDGEEGIILDKGNEEKYIKIELEDGKIIYEIKIAEGESYDILHTFDEITITPDILNHIVLSFDIEENDLISTLYINNDKEVFSLNIQEDMLSEMLLHGFEGEDNDVWSIGGLKGYYYQFGIYNRVLSDIEVEDRFNDGNIILYSGNEENLIWGSNFNSAQFIRDIVRGANGEIVYSNYAWGIVKSRPYLYVAGGYTDGSLPGTVLIEFD